MGKVIKSCLQCSLKVLNSTLGIIGIGMMFYGVWMIRVWQRDAAKASDDDPISTFPWFIQAFLGIGISLCAITLLGHLAAHTAHSYCLCCYIITVFVLLLLESALITDVFLNSDWEKDFPKDPSGRFKDFKHFVESNIEICQCVGLFAVVVQACSILLSTVLKILPIDHRRYNVGDETDHIRYSIGDGDDDGDDNMLSRLPLIDHYNCQSIPYVIGEPYFASNQEGWKYVLN